MDYMKEVVRDRYGAVARSSVTNHEQAAMQVADDWDDQFAVINSNGDFLFQFGGFATNDGEFISISDTAIDGQGRVYVADPFNDRVQVLDSDGNHLLTIANPPFGLTEFVDPFGVAVDSSGKLYVRLSQNPSIPMANSLGRGYVFNVVPEPSSIMLAALALLGVLAHGHRRRRA